MQSLQDLCIHSYLQFLERECKTWIDLKNSGSLLLRSVSSNIIPALKEHLACFLSGTSSSNFRGQMFREITSGKYPSDRYRNYVEGTYDSQTYTFGLFENFYHIHDDIVRHTKRCAKLCCTGVFIVETMLKVIINDELKELVFPQNLMDKIWNRNRGEYYEGGIERLVPFNYPALLSSYTESVLFSPPKENGLPLRYPSLTKLKIGNFDTIVDLKRNGHNWRLMKSFNVTRDYLNFLKYLAPSQHVFTSGVHESEFEWPLSDKRGVLPTNLHAIYAFKSIFDFFNPKSLCTLGKYGNLSEISLNNTQSMMFCDTRGIELFSAIGKAVPRLKVLDLSETLIFSGELILYLLYQDAFQTLHEFMYLYRYKVLSLEERMELFKKTGHFRAVDRDTASDISLHSPTLYCPWCYDEGAYDDNLRAGCSQEFLKINVVDDRVWEFIENINFDRKLKEKCLLQSVSVSNLVKSTKSQSRILLRNSEFLPYESKFRPEPGTEHLGELDGEIYRPSWWYPPAEIVYGNIEDEAFGIQKINPLAESLQVLRVPPFSRSLWGEIIPFVLQCCPNLKTLGKASGTLLGLDLFSKIEHMERKQTNLEEVFMHLDLLKQSDYMHMETPNPSRLGHGDTVSQNSPNLKFVVQNIGPAAFEEVKDDDDHDTIIRKEFTLDVWDFAKSLLPKEDITERLSNFIELICKTSPKTRAIHILSLSYIEGFYLGNTIELWNKLLSLQNFCELTLQISHLIQFAGLIKCVGTRLRKVSVTEMVGERDEPDISSQFEGLDLDEQGALFICEKCPFVEELDLVSVNYMRKFFFGRKIETVPEHFLNLTKLAIGKIDWNSFLQIWKLIVSMRDLDIIAICPMFTFNQQLFEEPKVLDIYEVQDLLNSNKRIRNCLTNLQIATLRFATFAAAEYFILHFNHLKTVGTIDTEIFGMDERNQMQELVRGLDKQKGIKVSLAEVFDIL